LTTGKKWCIISVIRNGNLLIGAKTVNRVVIENNKYHTIVLTIGINTGWLTVATSKDTWTQRISWRHAKELERIINEAQKGN
jgi:hypothetical protein